MRSALWERTPTSLDQPDPQDKLTRHPNFKTNCWAMTSCIPIYLAYCRHIQALPKNLPIHLHRHQPTWLRVVMVSCGSVGDIIAVGILIKGLIKCVDNSRGASSEFQAVNRELRSLEYALVEVQYLFLPRPREDTKRADILKSTVLIIAAGVEKYVLNYGIESTDNRTVYDLEALAAF